MNLYDTLQMLPPKKDKLPDEERLAAIERPLLAWYHSHARILPWREDPQAYRVWISEIMLQQTRVEAVKPYFERFMAALPDVVALAAVDEDVLLKLWEGLGYYNRARNLKKAAQMVMEEFDGTLPDSYEALLKLPGIGSYTAGAICSIAYGIPHPAVDGNVLRVISRVTGSREDILKQTVKKQMEVLLQSVMPGKEASSYNQGLIEIGAIVCVPNGAPLCGVCPLASLCVAKRDGLTDVIPVKTPKKARRVEERTVFLLNDGDRTAIRKRPDTGLLASMYELPNIEGTLNLTEAARMFGIPGSDAEPLGEARHIFTHVEWHMTGYRINLSSGTESKACPSLLRSAERVEDYVWALPEEVREIYSLPNAFKAYTKLIR